MTKDLDVNAKDDTIKTPLHMPVERMSCEFVEVSINKQADNNAKNEKWETPLQMAKKNIFLEGFVLMMATYTESTVNPSMKMKINDD